MLRLFQTELKQIETDFMFMSSFVNMYIRHKKKNNEKEKNHENKRKQKKRKKNHERIKGNERRKEAEAKNVLMEK